MDRNEDSVKTLETILTVEVNHADAHFALGAAYDKIGQGEKAMGHTRSAENLFTKENNSFMMAQAAKNLSHFMRKFRPLVNGDSE
ncbi:MAG: hypothetical protein NPINA01_17620 [Nitrospinaceae bacterium]|nr:MAG: hypothetical protein NPINA01_17620 [Nitrospinaceae bacterium]